MRKVQGNVSNISNSTLTIVHQIDECFKEKFFETGSSTDYLNAISYNVPLAELFKFKKTCQYHMKMDNCPVILELNEPTLREHYKGKFLLQVWNKKGQKVYQKALQYDLHCWAIQHDYFLFKLNPQEQDAEHIFIIKIDSEGACATLKLKDPVNDLSYLYMGVNQELFYYGNEKMIQVADIQPLMPPSGQQKEATVAAADILSYPITGQNRLLGFFENGFSKNDTYIMCAVETEDNQIDFTRLYKWERSVAVKDLQFYQYREVVKRELRNDPIVKFDQVINMEEFQFGVALRRSGLIDIYWNFTLVNSPKKMTFTNIDATFKALFVTRSDGVVLQMSNKWDARIGIDVSKEYLCETIAYNNCVSIYDLFKGRWSQHFYFDSDIYTIKRNQKATVALDSSFDTQYNFAVFLQNGIIKVIESASSDQTNREQWEIIEGEEKIGGSIRNIVSDSRDVTTQYILADNNGTNQMWAYQGQKLFPLKDQVKDLTNDDVLIRLFSDCAQYDFIIFNKTSGKVRFYSNESVLTNYENKVDVKMFKEDTIQQSYLITGTLHSAFINENMKGLIVFDEKNFYRFNSEDKDPAKQYQTYENFNFRYIYQVDHGSLYSMNAKNGQENGRSQEGIYFQNLLNIIDADGQDRSYHLQHAIVGINSVIDYNKENERLTYMISYDQVVVVPLLHRNILQFIGMKSRENYVAFKRDKDKVISLGKDNYLTSWSIVTGKMLTRNKLKIELDLSKWEMYSCEAADVTYKQGWYFPRFLLKCTAAIEDFDETTFFDKDMLTTSLENNTAYLKIVQKTFHEFKMVEIINEREVYEHFRFIHPCYQDVTAYQRIYFNDSLEYMLERLLNQRVFLYKKVETGEHGVVKWQMIRRINQFPKDISECTYNNFLFSPDFKYYLDYDKKSEIFLIKNVFTQQFHCKLPRGLMNPNLESPATIAKKFRWIDSNRIRLINNQGIEKVLDISNGFKEVAYGIVPFFDEQKIESQKDFHYHFSPSTLQMEDTYGRLKKKFNEYKSAYYLDGHQGSKIYEVLFNVEFASKDKEETTKVVADLSFTFLHWKKIRSIIKKDRYDFKLIEPNELRALCLNILPRCETIIHFADTKLFIVKKIFNIAKQQRQLLENGLPKEFYIPIIKDINGFSAIEKCFQKQNCKSADILLSNLMDEPLDHHGRAIINALPQIVEHELPSLGQYLNSRFMQTKQLEAIRRGKIKTVKEADYGIGVAQMWTDIKQLEAQVLAVSPLDTEIKLELLDIPQIHCYQEKIGDEFFEALGNVSLNYFQIFGETSIQALIDYKWPLVKEYTIKALFLPFLLYLLTFVLYSNIFFGQIEVTDQVLIADYVLSIILLVLSTYFLMNEFKQLVSNGINYFKSFWNYSDILPPILIITVVIVHFIKKDEPPVVLQSVHSVACLLIWTKFLYFLRIFRETGYFIRMLTDVVYDIRIFLLILLIMYFGFGEAFLRIAEQSTSEDGQFVGNYIQAIVFAYFGSLGQQDIGGFISTDQSVYIYIIYIIEGILISIIMLNLLIAIISEAFAKINENIILANYQERAKIIAENSYLIPQRRKIQFCEKNKYMIVAREKEEKEVNTQEELVNQIKSIQEQFAEFKAEIGSTLATILENQKK